MSTKLWQYEHQGKIVVMMMHDGVSLCLRNDFYESHVGKMESYNDDKSGKLEELMARAEEWTRLA